MRCSMTPRLLMAATLCSSLCLPGMGLAGASSEGDSLDAVHRIKDEAFEHSKVMDTLEMLTDRYGPRLTGSPEFEEAATWAQATLKGYGLVNVHAEKWGPFGRSWSLEGYSLEMTTPRYSHMVTVPLAWSEPTKATESGEALYAPFRVANRYNLAMTREAFEQYKKEWKGKLKGRVVLATELARPKPSEQPLFKRYTAADLGEIGQAPEPAMHEDGPLDKMKFPIEPEETMRFLMRMSPAAMDDFYDRYLAQVRERSRFYREEGALAVVSADARAHNGLLFAEQAGSEKSSERLALPTYVVPEEQYSRLVRLLEKNEKVELRFNLEAKVSDSDVDGKNLVGEIAGRKKPDEVVMIGAHFDSWHSGTGATDNGAGSAVMMEVMRILKKLDLPMDRTVRIGLWSGEEQGLYGSRAYVTQHFGDAKTMQLKPEHAKLDAYLNLDNGSGKIRGVYLEGNDAARPVFEGYLRPFADMGATATTLKHTGGTDHLSFDAVGLPGFQFIQDPLDYGTVTHHSDVDTFSHAIPEDLMQASAIIASLVYDIANREEAFPRKPLPVAAGHAVTGTK